MMFTRKDFTVLLLMLLICAVLSSGFGSAVFAQGEMAVTEAAGTEFRLENQLSLEDIQTLNDGKAEVYTHNSAVTFIDGTCTPVPVNSMEEAAQVILSTIGLLGGDERTLLEPWRTLNDSNGNTYYVFRQMYAGVTVTGGAVKLVTDQSGNMIALISSLEADLPEEGESIGITAAEAEQIVSDHMEEAGYESVYLLEDSTDMMILPMVLSVDDEDVDGNVNRFVWAVYTENPEAGFGSTSELPYLAHYVSMAGEYLYSLATIRPGDAAGSIGFDSAYVFEFMEPADYTGYVDLSDGTEMEISVTLMRDKRTGMYYLGNIERQIVVADCYEFLYNHGRVVLEYSPDNLEWDQIGLLSLYNYCRAWDYYKTLGWIGGDGQGTPILILNNFCDKDHVRVNNAAFVGNYLGWSLFAASLANDYSQCLDVIAHEFTHCVTDAVMTYNSYVNDYGAINEAISDIHGEIADQMYNGKDDAKWILGDSSTTPVRSMSDPHYFQQPEYSWDLYYKPSVSIPTVINDYGGVHSNSSLLNNVAYHLIEDGRMSLEEAQIYWFAVDCAMVPGTDYAQLSELLPWMLEAQGMENYLNALLQAIDATRLGNDIMPEVFDEDRAMLMLELPDNENFTDGNWGLQIISVDVDHLIERGSELIAQVSAGDYSGLPQFIQDRQKEEAEQQKQESPGFFETLFAVVSEILDPSEEPVQEPDPELVAKEKAENAEMMEWLRANVGDLIYSNMSSAGQDGKTIRMVARPGLTFPILIHMKFDENSMEPDQQLFALYLKDHWYVLPSMDDLTAEDGGGNSLLESDLGNIIKTDIIEGIFSGRKLGDTIRLWTFRIEGGKVCEITADGLENVTLPEPSERVQETAPADPGEPGKKSRPKLD